MNDETLVCCFSCSEIRTVAELTVCPECGVATCGMGRCTTRCGCTALRHIEHPEDAKAYYSAMDELNAGENDPSRVAALEMILDTLEQRHGW